MENYKNKLGNLADKLKKEAPKTPIQEVLPVKAETVGRGWIVGRQHISEGRPKKGNQH